VGKETDITSNSIEIVPYIDSYIDEIINLLSNGLRYPFSKDRWRWLHFQNIMAPSAIYVAKSGNTIIGVYAAIKKEIVVNGKNLIAGRDIDPVVNPQFRGKGIFSKLLKESDRSERDIVLNVNFANELSKPGYKSNGWKEIKIKKLFAPRFPVLSWFYKVIFLDLLTIEIKTKDLHILPIDSIDEFNINVQLIRIERPIYIKKSGPYFYWRYKGNPDKNYHFFKVSRAGIDIGIIICSKNRGRLMILDIINQSSVKKNQILKSFLKYYLESPYKIMLVTWSTLCEGADRMMMFGKPGEFFVKNKSSIPDEYIFNTKNWELGPGESEFL